MARPDTVTIAVAGDASVMFTIQDLMTAVQEKIPVVVMVFNDRGYGVERRHQDHLYGRRSGVDIVPPDFVALAKAFGARGLSVSDLSKVGATLESVLDTDETGRDRGPQRVSPSGLRIFRQLGRARSP